jgi:Ni,Fe-hydrogenase III component G
MKTHKRNYKMTNTIKPQTLTALRKEFKELKHTAADKKWSKEDLVIKIEMHKKRVLELAAERLQEKADQEQAEADRKVRIERNGSICNFLSMQFDRKSDEAKLQRSVDAANRAVNNYASIKAKFIEGIESDPQYAMSWSISFFKSTAEYRVAMETVYHFEAGGTYAKLIERATKEALRGATYPPSSTSATSNLAETSLNSAWAMLATDRMF